VTADSRLTLTDEQLDRLADRVAIRLAATKPPGKPMLTVDDVCTTFQVSRAWVYENAGRLGGVKLGPGQRAPLRFDANRVAAALNPLMGSSAPDPPTPASTKPPGRKRPKRLHPVYDG
jgi:hypothetical protein